MPINPIELFGSWLKEACQTDMHEPTAMAVATIDAKGYPSVRILLLKTFDERGFCFFTNLTSRKGKELLENPKASLCFYWDILDRQVRIEGEIERVSEKEADDYFATRRRGSQIGAWASKQSCTMGLETDLITRVASLTKEFKDQATIPRPPFWSGFRLKPKHIEFWEKAEFRLHKRTVFTQSTQGWEKSFLYP